MIVTTPTHLTQNWKRTELGEALLALIQSRCHSRFRCPGDFLALSNFPVLAHEPPYN